MREARNFLVLRKKNLNLPQNEGEAVVFSKKTGPFAKRGKKEDLLRKRGEKRPFREKRGLLLCKTAKKEAYPKKEEKETH